MKWFTGFLLGAVGGWAIGCLAGPNGSRVAIANLPLGRFAGSSDAENSAPAGPGSRPAGLLPDERLTRRARERIVERGVDDLRVDVTTVDGVMYLRGRPGNARDAAAILDVAETTPGVTQVVNELKPRDQE